jgi:hypothetical protein
LMGEAGKAAKEFAADTAETLGSRAKEAFQEASKEAEAQGLTPAAAKDQLQGLADKLKTVAGSTRDSIKDRFS